MNSTSSVWAAMSAPADLRKQTNVQLAGIQFKEGVFSGNEEKLIVQSPRSTAIFGGIGATAWLFSYSMGDGETRRRYRAADGGRFSSSVDLRLITELDFPS